MKVLGILNRKFMPCTAIKLRFQELRPYKKNSIAVRQRDLFSTRCRSAIHYLRRFLGLKQTAYDQNQADMRATA
jgi:hypothetical protein